MGFPVPFGRWTRGQWNGAVADVLLDRRTRERGVIDPAAAATLLADHRAGRTDGWDRIWMLLNLELWFRTFIDGDGVQTLAAPSSSDASAVPLMAHQGTTSRVAGPPAA